MRLAINRALNDSQRGLANYHPKVDEDALEYFATQSQGDVRSALNALELVAFKCFS